ncbi:hypothetical protein [Microbacterium sp. H1-D42]|uniref:hypothetical protein n=1 Tax=Microbacterium sp. H1-D42 TaxID=2925844 RepID=UPI001F539669|nr:hypothetical protein [Microbacterium sp. H1-D42]UNK70143.1 hypothetical protein MNR00_13365 [Microbacterium sp. H1-D42]
MASKHNYWGHFMSENEQGGISRRTVTKAMAWAVPAVAVASSVPLAAASEIVTVSQAGDACKLPGESCKNNTPSWSKGYLQPLQICNNSNTDTITVSISVPATLTFNGQAENFTPIPGNFTVGPNQCQNVVLNLNLQDNSQNSSISGTLFWTWESQDQTQSGNGSTPISTGSTPPCVNCTV